MTSLIELAAIARKAYFAGPHEERHLRSALALIDVIEREVPKPKAGATWDAACREMLRRIKEMKR